MAKRLSPEQRTDRQYVEWYLKIFYTALANEDASEAEEMFNELTGVLNCMLERVTGNE